MGHSVYLVVKRNVEVILQKLKIFIFIVKKKLNQKLIDTENF